MAMTEEQALRKLTRVFKGNEQAARAALAVLWPAVQSERALCDALAGDLESVLTSHGCDEIACRQARVRVKRWKISRGLAQGPVTRRDGDRPHGNV